MHKPEVSIIIVNYRTPDLTIRCVESIVQTTRVTYEIIVVDNDSQDDSVEQIRHAHPTVQIIENTENEGFGRANNLGAAHAKGTYLLLINSDVILQENCIDHCLELLKQEPQTGVLGCKLVNDDGSDQNSQYFDVASLKSIWRTNVLIDKFFTFKRGELEAVMGAFFFIPRDLFRELGGFDPDFFMYAEELELCKRVRARGFTVKFIEDVIAIHKHGASSIGSTWSIRQNLLSNALLYLKTGGLLWYLAYHVTKGITHFFNLLVLWKMEKQFRRDYWFEVRMYYSNFWGYFAIPFRYSKRYNSGKTYLKLTR